MNILFFYPEENTNMGQWQKYHILDELQHHGHVIYLFNPLIFPSIEQANLELIKYIKNSKCIFNLFVNSLGSDLLFPYTVMEIKKIGVSTLLICFDNLHAPFMHKTIAPHFDLVWLTSKETRDMFVKWGCNIVFMPYAANPKIFKPNPDIEIPIVGFIGNPYGSRTNKLNKLLKSQIKCQIYSNATLENSLSSIKRYNYSNLLKSGIDLMRFKIGRRVILGALKNKYFSNTNNLLVNSSDLERNPSVSFEKMIYLYSNFAISLGITDLRNTYTLEKPIHKLHLRTFEIPMCGGLQLSSYTDELAGYFEEDKEIILYKTDDEMVSKTKFYLEPMNKFIRNRMKINARIRAENEHTWMIRFNTAFKLLSI